MDSEVGQPVVSFMLPLIIPLFDLEIIWQGRVMGKAWTTTLMQRLSASFEAHANPARAAPMAAYMKDRFPFLGISATERRALQRRALKGLPESSERELRTVARASWRKPEREYQYFGADYVRAHVARCSADFLEPLEALITTKSWWDTVDLLATRGVGRLAREHPSVRRAMDAWIESDNVWLVRSALLFQLTYKSDTDAAALFGYCEQRMDDEDFFIRKAMGWALREYSKTDAPGVRTFVLAHRDSLSPLTRREALKWLER